MTMLFASHTYQWQYLHLVAFMRSTTSTTYITKESQIECRSCFLRLLEGRGPAGVLGGILHSSKQESMCSLCKVALTSQEYYLYLS